MLPPPWSLTRCSLAPPLQMVEQASAKFVCIVDDSKLVEGLGGSKGAREGCLGHCVWGRGSTILFVLLKRPAAWEVGGSLMLGASKQALPLLLPFWWDRLERCT